MENTLSLYLKKYGIAICLVINQAICIYLLSYQSDFKSPRIYLHLITLATIALIAIKYPEYQRIRWGAMLIIAVLLLIFYLMEVKYAVWKRAAFTAALLFYFPFFCAASHSIMVTGLPFTRTGDPSKSVLGRFSCR